MRTPGSNVAKSTASGMLVALLTLGLAGCASADRSPAGPSPAAPSAAAGPSPTTAGAVPNPCTLVTAEELGAAVGKVKKQAVRVMLTESGEEQQGLRCEWTYPNREDLTDTATIRITGWRGLAHYTPDTQPEGFRPVSGIGDAAHASAAVFMFRRGEDVLRIHVSGDADNARIEPAIARLLAGKLA